MDKKKKGGIKKICMVSNALGKCIINFRAKLIFNHTKGKQYNVPLF